LPRHRLPTGKHGTVTAPVLVGRSSSHYTRVAKIFAHELGVEHEFRPVFDIAALDSSTFADNPALRVPSLLTDGATWFGSQNVCRELARRATRPTTIVWPEELGDATSANAQELVLEAMAAEVTIVMARAAALEKTHPFLEKPKARIDASVAWLERELPGVLARLPQPALSFLEVTAFCLCTHLDFREVRSIDDCPKLLEFVRRFETRDSARVTEYRFDRRSE
jgi:glutathione S-transferase